MNLVLATSVCGSSHIPWSQGLWIYNRLIVATGAPSEVENVIDREWSVQLYRRVGVTNAWMELFHEVLALVLAGISLKQTCCGGILQNEETKELIQLEARISSSLAPLKLICDRGEESANALLQFAQEKEKLPHEPPNRQGSVFTHA